MRDRAQLFRNVNNANNNQHILHLFNKCINNTKMQHTMLQIIASDVHKIECLIQFVYVL